MSVQEMVDHLVSCADAATTLSTSKRPFSGRERGQAFKTLYAAFANVELPAEPMPMGRKEGKEHALLVAGEMAAAFTAEAARVLTLDSLDGYDLAVFAATVDPMWVELAACLADEVQAADAGMSVLASKVVASVVKQTRDQHGLPADKVLSMYAEALSDPAHPGYAELSAIMYSTGLPIRVVLPVIDRMLQ